MAFLCLGRHLWARYYYGAITRTTPLSSLIQYQIDDGLSSSKTSVAISGLQKCRSLEQFALEIRALQQSAYSEFEAPPDNYATPLPILWLGYAGR